MQTRTRQVCVVLARVGGGPWLLLLLLPPPRRDATRRAHWPHAGALIRSAAEGVEMSRTRFLRTLCSQDNPTIPLQMQRRVVWSFARRGEALERWPKLPSEPPRQRHTGSRLQGLRLGCASQSHRRRRSSILNTLQTAPCTPNTVSPSPTAPHCTFSSFRLARH
jgi:hypothetical protein